MIGERWQDRPPRERTLWSAAFPRPRDEAVVNKGKRLERPDRYLRSAGFVPRFHTLKSPVTRGIFQPFSSAHRGRGKAALHNMTAADDPFHA